MKISIICLFPEFFENLIGLIKTAQDSKIFSMDLIPLREFGSGKHQKVDDQIFGGMDGMLLAPEILTAAVDFAKQRTGYEKAQVIALTPKGRLWTQAEAKIWSKDSVPKILVCGRYAGFDQRFLENQCDDEISIGDYILNGGEVAALVMLESVVRLLPGVLGNSESSIKDSFSQNDILLEAPQYTRPRDWNGMKSPKILFSGHHQNIEQWTNAASIIETHLKRPELLNANSKAELKKLIKNADVKVGLEETYSEDQLKKVFKWIKS